MSERVPVSTLADLATLDDDEISEGYRDGREGWPCGENRSRSYWHGWRNAQADQHKMPTDDAMRSLAREYVAFSRAFDSNLAAKRVN